MIFAMIFKRTPLETGWQMNSNNDDVILQLLKQVIHDVDSSRFPITTLFIQRLENIAKHFPNEEGSISTDRLALSLITMIGALEERMNSLEEKVTGDHP